MAHFATGEVTLTAINLIAPQHDTGGCQDQIPNAAGASRWLTIYDTSKRMDRVWVKGCLRCYLLNNKGHWFEDLPYRIELRVGVMVCNRKTA